MWFRKGKGKLLESFHQAMLGYRKQEKLQHFSGGIGHCRDNEVACSLAMEYIFKELLELLSRKQCDL
jgi:hypothetical protein